MQLDLTAWDSNIATRSLALDPKKCGGLAIVYRAEGFSGQTSGQVFSATKAEPGSLRVGFSDGRAVGADYMTFPRFRVDDPSATVLARYANNREIVAAAAKGKMVFYGGALLDADFVRRIARDSGVHIYCGTDDNLTAGNGIVSIHCNRPGVKTVRFPKTTDAVDLFTGEILGRGVTEVTFPMAAFATRVLITGDADELCAALKD